MPVRSDDLIERCMVDTLQRDSHQRRLWSLVPNNDPNWSATLPYLVQEANVGRSLRRLDQRPVAVVADAVDLP